MGLGPPLPPPSPPPPVKAAFDLPPGAASLFPAGRPDHERVWRERAAGHPRVQGGPGGSGGQEDGRRRRRGAAVDMPLAPAWKAAALPAPAPPLQLPGTRAEKGAAPVLQLALPDAQLWMVAVGANRAATSRPTPACTCPHRWWSSLRSWRADAAWASSPTACRCAACCCACCCCCCQGRPCGCAWGCRRWRSAMPCVCGSAGGSRCGSGCRRASPTAHVLCAGL